MAGLSAYIGALLLLYSCFHSAYSTCDCQAKYQQCLTICDSPGVCTGCVRAREDCDSVCSSGKRSSEDWKPGAHAKSVDSPDQDNHLWLSHIQNQNLKYLLRNILAKREKYRQH